MFFLSDLSHIKIIRSDAFKFTLGVVPLGALSADNPDFAIRNSIVSAIRVQLIAVVAILVPFVKFKTKLAKCNFISPCQNNRK
jgi:hypothetical protein